MTILAQKSYLFIYLCIDFIEHMKIKEFNFIFNHYDFGNYPTCGNTVEKTL